MQLRVYIRAMDYTTIKSRTCLLLCRNVSRERVQNLVTSIIFLLVNTRKRDPIKSLVQNLFNLGTNCKRKFI